MSLPSLCVAVVAVFVCGILFSAMMVDKQNWDEFAEVKRRKDERKRQ